MPRHLDAEQRARNFGRAQRELFNAYGTGGLGSGLFRKPVYNMLVPVLLITPSISWMLVALLDMLENPDNLNPKILKPTEPPLNTVTLDHQLSLQKFAQIDRGLYIEGEDYKKPSNSISDNRYSIGFNCIPSIPKNQARLSTIPVTIFPFDGDLVSLDDVENNLQEVIKSQEATCTPPSVMVHSPQSSLILLRLTEDSSKEAYDEQDNLANKLITKLRKTKKTALHYKPDILYLRVNIHSRKDLNTFVVAIITKTIERIKLSRQFVQAYNSYFNCPGSDMTHPLAVDNVFDRLPWSDDRQVALNELPKKIANTPEFKAQKKYEAIKAVKEFASCPKKATFEKIQTDHTEALLNWPRFFYGLLQKAIQDSPKPASITLFSRPSDRLRAWLNSTRRAYPKSYPTIVRAIHRNKALDRYNVLISLLNYAKKPSVEAFLMIQEQKDVIINDVKYFNPLIGKIAKADFHADRCAQRHRGPKAWITYWLDDPESREAFRPFHASHKAMRDHMAKCYIPLNPNRRKLGLMRNTTRDIIPRRRSSSAPYVEPQRSTFKTGSAP